MLSLGMSLATPRRARGFTLIEMMVVVTIMGVMLAIGVPSYRTWIENSQIRARADAIADGIRFAKSEAIKSNQRTRFSLVDPNNCVPVSNGKSWVVWVDPAAAPSAIASCADARITRAGGAAPNSRNVVVTNDVVTAALVGAGTPLTTITFTSLGRVAENIQGGWWVNFDVPTTVLPAADSRNLRLTVTQAGQIRQCDPDAEGRLSATDTRKC